VSSLTSAAINLSLSRDISPSVNQKQDKVGRRVALLAIARTGLKNRYLGKENYCAYKTTMAVG